MFQVLAAILHLGNLCFEDGRGGEAELLTPQPLAVAAALLRVPLAALASAVLYHPPTTSGQRRRARDAAGAVAAADALACGLYAALLRRLTAKMNASLRPPPTTASTSCAFTVVESPAFQVSQLLLTSKRTIHRRWPGIIERIPQRVNTFLAGETD